VSVPTVYRYFRSKQELLRGLAESYEASLGGGRVLPPPPLGLADFPAYVRGFFLRYERIEPALRAVMLTEVGNEARATLIPERMRVIEDWLSNDCVQTVGRRPTAFAGPHPRTHQLGDAACVQGLLGAGRRRSGRHRGMGHPQAQSSTFTLLPPWLG
jgi:AcrR family transcriptional regulator